MATLILARHGETDWNRDGRWQGHADRPLNELGREQAGALAATLADEPVAAVYSSDLRRARDTAAIVARTHGLGVEVDPRLREIERRYPGYVERWPPDDGKPFPRGETYAAMGERVVRALTEIAERHAEETVVVILHGGPIRSALAHAAGITYAEQRERRGHLANCDVLRIAVQEGAFTPVD